MIQRAVLRKVAIVVAALLRRPALVVGEDAADAGPAAAHGRGARHPPAGRLRFRYAIDLRLTIGRTRSLLLPRRVRALLRAGRALRRASRWWLLAGGRRARDAVVVHHTRKRRHGSCSPSSPLRVAPRDRVFIRLVAIPLLLWGSRPRCGSSTRRPRWRGALVAALALLVLTSPRSSRLLPPRLQTLLDDRRVAKARRAPGRVALRAARAVAGRDPVLACRNGSRGRSR